MSSAPQHQPRRTWRSSTRTSARRHLALPRWRREGDVALRLPRARSYVWRGVLGGLLTLLFSGLLVWVVLWLWPPRPACVKLIGAGYHENLAIPHNAYGWNGLLELAETVEKSSQTHSAWGRFGLRLMPGPIEMKDESSWSDGLSEISERTGLVVLSLHGAADDDQRGPYLLRDVTNPLDTKRSRLYVADVIERLAELAPRRFVVVLDATQVSAAPELGFLRNDFAMRLREKLGPVISKTGNVVVICSSDAGQRSWVSEEWRETVFLHYLAEGLAGGAADGNGGRITAASLFDFTQKHVTSWVSAHRRSLQTPFLLPEDSPRASSFELSLAPDRPVAPAPTPSGALMPDDLREVWTTEWDRYATLAARIPQPIALLPHAWRSYRDTLLRLEEVALATSTSRRAQEVAREKVRSLRRALDSLHERLTRSTPTPVSARFGLGLSHALGEQTNELAEEAAQFDSFWTADDREENQDALRKRVPPAPAISFFERLLRKVTDASDIDMPQTLARVARRLEVMPRPRPAEAHLLAMILRDKPAEPSNPAAYNALIRKAVDTRIRAGRSSLAVSGPTISRCEQVAPRIQHEITEADSLRRRAEDLVFTDDPVSWNEAMSLFNRADQLYRRADDRGRVVRDAIEVRDQAFADLPYFVEWAARRLPLRLAPGTDQPPEDLPDRIGDACEHAHELSGVLEENAAGDVSEDRVQILKRELAELHRWCRGAFEVQLTLADPDYSEIRSALVTPFPERKSRESLLRALERLARGPGSPAEALPTVEGTVALNDFEAGRWGRLSLRLLGERWKPGTTHQPYSAISSPGSSKLTSNAADTDPASTLSEPADDGDTRPGEITQTTDRKDLASLFLLKSQRVLELVDSKEWLSAGSQIGARWAQLPRAISHWVTSASQSSVGSWPSDLAYGDRLSRLSPGRTEPKADLTAILFHQRLVQNLLLTEARRSLEDHWFGDTMEEPPYYRVAGQALLSDADGAESLPSSGGGRVQAVDPIDELRKVLQREGAVKIVADGAPPTATGGEASQNARIVTSEPEVRLRYRVTAAAGAWVPAGTPVIWLNTGDESLARLREPQASNRLRRDLPASAERGGGEVTSLPIAVRVAIPNANAIEKALPSTSIPSIQKTPLVAHGRFRGQILRMETPMILHSAPEITRAEYPPPTRGHVAVRSDANLINRYGVGGGAVAIVLDCSGSMSAVTGKSSEDKPITKYQEATSAVREVLKRITRGTQVSLWVFGQQLRPNDDTPAEQTIRQILPPTRWRENDAALLKEVMQRIEPPALVPYNETPLLRAMLAAREDLRYAEGYKTLLVVTDGKDNRYANDSIGNRDKKDIPTTLRDAFGGSDIAINVVGFRVVSAEEDEVRKQFQVIEQLSQPGHFYSVKDGLALTAILTRALRPNLQIAVETAGNEPVQSLSVNRDGYTDQFSRPGLSPGGYKLVAQLGGRVERDLTIKRGDALIARLGLKEGKPTIDRVLANDGSFPAVPSGDRSWFLSAVRNGLSSASHDQLELWATLEKDVREDETALEMLRPRESWFEVEPAPGSEQEPFAQRWTTRYGLPAPFWGVRVSDWPRSAGTPTPARPILRSWWDPDQSSPYTTALVQLADFRSADEILAREVRVDDLPPLIVEGVAIEKHRVQIGEVASDEPVFAERSCLVVRLTLPPGQRFYVRPIGLRPDGAEHRFYTRANRYTAMFWTVTDDQAELNLKGLAVVSLTRFQERARKRGYLAELKTLPAPASTDLGPALIPHENSDTESSVPGVEALPR